LKVGSCKQDKPKLIPPPSTTFNTQSISTPTSLSRKESNLL